MRRRITWSIVGVSAIALLVLGLPLALAVGRLYHNEAVLQLEREASEARRAINVGELAHRDPVELANDGPIEFGIYDRTGRLISGRGPKRADRPVRRALRGTVHDGRLRSRIVVGIPIDDREHIVGALRASRPDSVVIDRTHRAWIIMGLVGGSALVISILLSRRQARRLVRPVDALVESAERLGSGDFAVRTARSGVRELDELGAAMDATADRLGSLLARERSFSADASHQLRTPIAALRVAVETALISPDGELRPTLERLLEPIDRLETTVDDLLALARDTHGDRAPLDITALLDGVSDHWRGRLADLGRPLRVRIDPHLDRPLVSASALRQILDVLLANALQHGSGTVTVHARQAPGATVIAVGDEGPGVTDDSAFERRDGGGHGIGLALARTLAEAEGGRLVLDAPGPRPLFSIVLPASGI